MADGGHRPFPEQFSKPVRKVLSAISMGTPNVVGSSEDHRVMYSADYDLMEEVPLTAANVRAFQRLVKGLGRVGKVTDIKIGEVKEWNLMKGAKYDQKRELAHLNELWRSKVITSKELGHAKDLLKPHLTVPEKLRVRKELRFGVLRWTPSDVATGHIQYRGQTFYLPTAMKSSGITKVDVVAWVKDRYVEVSNIILWLKRKGVPYAHLQSLKKGLAEDILLYEDDGNYIKVAKRMLSLAKAEGHKTDEGKLIELLNSELGAVYTIVSDLEVLEEFPQATVPAKRREELDLMRDRMAKLYFRQFDHVMDPKKLLPQLKEVLQDGTKALMLKEHLLPIAKHYRVGVAGSGQTMSRIAMASQPPVTAVHNFMRASLEPLMIWGIANGVIIGSSDARSNPVLLLTDSTLRTALAVCNLIMMGVSTRWIKWQWSRLQDNHNASTGLETVVSAFIEWCRNRRNPIHPAQLPRLVQQELDSGNTSPSAVALHPESELPSHSESVVYDDDLPAMNSESSFS